MQVQPKEDTCGTSSSAPLARPQAAAAPSNVIDLTKDSDEEEDSVSHVKASEASEFLEDSEDSLPPGGEPPTITGIVPTGSGRGARLLSTTSHSNVKSSLRATYLHNHQLV